MIPLISGFFISKGEKMAERENTNNPIPSNALADLSDNTIILDEWTNSTSDYTQDRFGIKFKTRYKILYDLQASINNIQSGSFLPLSGGTLTGALIGTDITVKNSLTVGSAKATYSTNGLNFDKNLLINNVAVLKVGDGGLYSTSLPFISDFKSLTIKSGFYRALGSNTSSPSLNAPTGSGNSILTVTVRSNGSATHYEVIENSAEVPIKWIGECYSAGETVVLKWDKVITTANISSYQSGLGINQTWQDVTSSRTVNTTYTNTTGRPIMVSITKQGTSSNVIVGDLYVDNIKVATNTGLSPAMQVSVIVPSGSTYRYTSSYIETWAELR